MQKQLFLVASALSLLAAPALADNNVGPHASAAYSRCMQAAQTHFAESYCLTGELTRQEANLKAAFEAYVAGIDPTQKRLIMVAQNAWEAYREKDCDAQKLPGGTAQGDSYITCMIRLTAARAVEMEGYGRY